jgi:uncharacterized membrane protein YedE/YeeE
MNGRTLFVALLCGALFGFGLARSTMVSPEVVLSFLQWKDFGLLMVLGGAVVVTFFAYRFAPRVLSKPLLGGEFVKYKSTLNRRTLLGAALFGIGWGLCGVCPGPAIAGIGAGNYPVLYALGGILVGAFIHGKYVAK